jgi:hypothetical protein
LPATAHRQVPEWEKNPSTGMRSLRSTRGAVAPYMKLSRRGDAPAGGSDGGASQG